MPTEMTTSGPWFDRELRDEILRRYKGRATGKIADFGVTVIQAYLPSQFKYDRPDPHPGLYVSQIHTELMVDDSAMITDTPVVYGPWLEGVGSRNFPVTRFRGYHTFRVMTRVVDAAAGGIADIELQPYLGELNA
jgi:hypothetical protein